MVKVCHMTSAHNSNDVRIFYKECVSLASAQYDTYLVGRGKSREESGVHIIGLGAPPAGRLKRMTTFAKTVYNKALTLDADIYHLHDPELIPYGLKLKKQGKKVIFDSHEDTLNQMSEKTWIPAALRPLVSAVYRKYAAQAFSGFDAIVSVTPHIVDELRLINPKTYQITNYPIVSSPKMAEKKADGSISLCFTGGIGAQWSHENILAAIADMDFARYVLCGSADSGYIEKLQALPGWKMTDYLGKVPHEEAVRIQGASHVGMALLRPSNNTGKQRGTIGNTKLFEYMMSGLPIICTDFELWKEIIDKYHCGICVNPDDVEAIASAIRYLHQHPDEACEMGRNGRRAVEEEFNWQTQEGKLLELYKEILE